MVAGLEVRSSTSLSCHRTHRYLYTAAFFHSQYLSTNKGDKHHQDAEATIMPYARKADLWPCLPTLKQSLDILGRTGALHGLESLHLGFSACPTLVREICYDSNNPSFTRSAQRLSCRCCIAAVCSFLHILHNNRGIHIAHTRGGVSSRQCPCCAVNSITVPLRLHLNKAI